MALAISMATRHPKAPLGIGPIWCARPTPTHKPSRKPTAKATRWLRQHAQYDDTHPWEALDIICTLLGHEPEAKQLEQLRLAICTSYRYMAMTLDRCMQMAPAKARLSG